MQKRFIIVASAFLFLGLVPPQAGCKALTPEVKQDILQKKDVACALENAFLSDERIAVLCGLADQFLRPILDLVSAQRVALAKSRAVGVTEGRASGATGTAGACVPIPASSEPKVGPTDAGTEASVTVQRDAGAKEAGSVPLKTK